jgi:hypothetical protein
MCQRTASILASVQLPNHLFAPFPRSSPFKPKARLPLNASHCAAPVVDWVLLFQPGSFRNVTVSSCSVAIMILSNGQQVVAKRAVRLAADYGFKLVNGRVIPARLQMSTTEVQRCWPLFVALSC